MDTLIAGNIASILCPQLGRASKGTEKVWLCFSLCFVLVKGLDSGKVVNVSGNTDSLKSLQFVILLKM